MALSTDVRIDNDFLAGTGLFVLFLVLVLSIFDLWSDHNENASDERIVRIEACADIEDAVERTLCLKK